MTPKQIMNKVNEITRNGKNEITNAYYLIQQDEFSGKFELTLTIETNRNWGGYEEEFLIGEFEEEQKAFFKAERLTKQKDDLNFKIEVSNC